MFVLKRNQIIVTALVAMIAIAGYLNYTDSQQVKDADIVYNENLDITDTIPDDAMIMGEMDLTDEMEEGIIGEAISTDPEILAQINSADLGEDFDSIVETAAGEESAVADEGEDDGAAVFVNSSTDTPYFAQAKLSREQARAKEREILSEILNNKSLDKEKKSQAADEMLKLQRRIEKESAMEAMIEAKGFKEVYVRISDDRVDVVVNKEKLTEQELAQIESIVRSTTGYDVDKIQIIPLKSH
ncbi:MAG TPA: SpoIIIAH-like family protein [Defluviitaleaceae bacterium]|jgi:stage III sporulation protein AH|nr:SpoIIIAH-like family protein [Candidatus Epulonipiscium sp.]HOQ16375.1 SpoIIIAH-like family protein [Defluviitaleaceae bacterium]HPT75808.1 SpoIIIAH-like family protein [Defluviitaleaceae bacterium]HQD51182.1 SpoIIIAH-like family protein [Defluviitaleaceae bacterium]